MAPSKPTPTPIFITLTPQPSGLPITYLGIPHPLTILPGKYGTTYEIISTLSDTVSPGSNFPATSAGLETLTTSSPSLTSVPTSTATGRKGGGGTITLPDGTVAGTAPGPGSNSNSDGNGNGAGNGQKAGSEGVRAGVGIGVVGFVLVFGACLLIWVRRRGGKRSDSS